MENMMQKAWDFIWNHLYDDCTGMFYNHLAGDAARASQYLPEPDLIRLLIPNPGGYGTAMDQISILLEKHNIVDWQICDFILFNYFSFVG